MEAEGPRPPVTDEELLVGIEKELILFYPDLKSLPEEIKQILPICFAPMTQPYINPQESKQGFVLLMKLPFIKVLQDALRDLEELVIYQEESTNFVKESSW
jgi:hypothetical protein